MIVLSVVGWGMSAVKRLKRQGERIAPWGTPFLICTSLDVWPFEMTLAVLPVKKFAIHFLRLFSMCVFSIFCMRRYVGTVSNALFMSIIDRPGSEFCRGRGRGRGRGWNFAWAGAGAGVGILLWPGPGPGLLKIAGVGVGYNLKKNS